MFRVVVIPQAEIEYCDPCSQQCETAASSCDAASDEARQGTTTQTKASESVTSPAAPPQLAIELHDSADAAAELAVSCILLGDLNSTPDTAAIELIVRYSQSATVHYTHTAICIFAI